LHVYADGLKAQFMIGRSGSKSRKRLNVSNLLNGSEPRRQPVSILRAFEFATTRSVADSLPARIHILCNFVHQSTANGVCVNITVATRDTLKTPCVIIRSSPRQ
jgi:hypothetical protein